jgi:hypothetical protein
MRGWFLSSVPLVLLAVFARAFAVLARTFASLWRLLVAVLVVACPGYRLGRASGNAMGHVPQHPFLFALNARQDLRTKPSGRLVDVESVRQGKPHSRVVGTRH